MSPDSFRSMGVEVLVAGASAGELAAVAGLFEEWDRTFSRFRPDSELSRVNAVVAPFVAVTPLFARVLRVALDAAAGTGGIVDPTLGPPPAGAPGRWREVRVAGRLVRRPPGVQLDLNGVVKALAADAGLALLAGEGFVAAGGDVAVRGAAAVGLPGGGTLRLGGGGMATSGTAKHRRHLLEPATGLPSESCWDVVTVAAGSCLTADVAAKAAFLLAEDGPAWLDERRLPGRFVAAGRTETNETWGRAMVGEAA